MGFVPYRISDFSGVPFEYIDGVGHYDAAVLMESFERFGSAFNVAVDSVSGGRVVLYDSEANLDGLRDDLVGFVNGMNKIVRVPLEFSFVVNRGWDVPVKYVVSDGSVSVIAGKVVFDEDEAEFFGDDVDSLLTEFVSGLSDDFRAEIVSEPEVDGLTVEEQSCIRDYVNSRIDEVFNGGAQVDGFGSDSALTVKDFSDLTAKTLSKDEADRINESWAKNEEPVLAKGSGTSVEDLDVSGD